MSTQPKNRRSKQRSRPDPIRASHIRVDHIRVEQPRTFPLIAATALAITPLALVNGVFISHDVIPKVILLTTCTALLLFLLPQWMPFLSTLWRQSAGRRFLILVLAQFTSLLLSTLFSNRFWLSLSGTVWRRFGLLEQTATLLIATAVACAALSQPAWIRTLLRAVSVCGGLAATYGILQYFNLDPFLERRLYAIDYLGGVVRPPGTMGHALYFSAYLVPVMLIAISAALHETAIPWRRIHRGAAVLAGAAMILSGTRSAVIAALVAGCFLGWRVFRGQTGNWSPKYVGGASIAALAISVFVFSPAGANLRGRIAQWRTEQGGPRLQMWRECPQLVTRHPALGVGPETFAGEFRKIQSAKLSREYPDFYNETPHNAFIDAACAQGIPGVLILAGVFALVWSAGRGGAFAANPLRAGLQAAMLGILITSMLASLTLVTSLYLWSIAALAVALNPEAKPAEEYRTPGLLAIPAIALGVIFLAAGAALALQDSAWSDLGHAVEDKDFSTARGAWSRAAWLGPRVPGYELWASREMASLGRSLGDSADGAAAWKLAAASASLAEQGSEERFSAAYQSSVLAFAAGDPAQAEFKAREIIRLAPNWYKGHLLLSQILQIVGKNDEAATEAELSQTLGWKK